MMMTKSASKIRVHILPIVSALLVAGMVAHGEEVIRLYPGPAPGTESWTQSEKQYVSPLIGAEVVANVSQPTLTAYLPDPSVANGTAVIIAPGGAYYFLSINSEGVDVAKWLNARGVAAFLLRYRLFPTGEDAVQDLRNHLGEPGKLQKNMKLVAPFAGADGLAALRYVRENARKYGVAPDRIGFMGFSAGGGVTVHVATHYDPANRPDFVAPIYAGGDDFEGLVVPADAPPMFVVAAANDPLVPVKTSVALYNKWIAAGRSAEMHVYARGGHGFGMNKQGLPIDSWVERFADWLESELPSPAPKDAAIPAGVENGVSGEWRLEIKTSRGSGSPAISLKQAGENISGQYRGTFGGAAVSGTVKGDGIEFSYPGYVSGEKAPVTYRGAVEGNSMKGTVEFGERGRYGTGTFTGKRAVPAPTSDGPSRPPVKSSMETAVTPEVMSFLSAHVKDLVSQVDVRRDVVFGETPKKNLLLDVYSPKGRGDAPLPCVVWIHGGALKSLTKDWNIIRWCAAHTARAGFVSVSIDYRLLQEAELPAAIIDAKTAVRFVRAHAEEFGIDPSRIAVAGESAGGYLASFVAFAAGAPEFQFAREAETKNDVACAVIWYTPVWPELAFHPLDYISKEDPPALFVHGDHDSLVNPADSKTFVDRCHAVGASAELLVIENAEHGLFDINGNVDAYQAHMTEALDATVAFLRKHLD